MLTPSATLSVIEGIKGCEVFSICESARSRLSSQIERPVEDDGRVWAIGNTGEDSWIDVTDKFTKKTFAELNIVIKSLKVY